MKVDKEGAAVLGDGRPSEDTFKIHGENKCDHCKCNWCGYECYNPSVLRRHLSLFLRNK